MLTTAGSFRDDLDLLVANGGTVVHNLMRLPVGCNVPRVAWQTLVLGASSRAYVYLVCQQ
jgi:hypothetical protein